MKLIFDYKFSFYTSKINEIGSIFLQSPVAPSQFMILSPNQLANPQQFFIVAPNQAPDFTQSASPVVEQSDGKIKKCFITPHTVVDRVYKKRSAEYTITNTTLGSALKNWFE